MFHRSLLAVLLLVTAGVAFGQPTLTAQEVIAVLRGHTDGWVGVLEGGNSGLTHEGLIINVVGVTFRTRAMSEWYAAQTSPPPGPVACGVFPTCEVSGSAVYQGYRSAGIATRGIGATCNNPAAEFRNRVLQRGGGQTTVGSCMSFESAAVDVVNRGNSHLTHSRVVFSDYGGSMLLEWGDSLTELSGAWVCPLDDCIFVSDVQFLNAHRGYIDGGLVVDQPTVSDLESDYGVSIVGAYVDGGWGEEVDPGGPGPDPGGPDDELTNCGILDIPCNLRRLLIPQEDWGEAFAAVDVGERVPFGFLSWIPGRDCLEGCQQSNNMQTARVDIHDGEQPGNLAGSLIWRIPSPAMVWTQIWKPGTGGGFDYIEFDLRDVPYIDLWHRHLRIWLYWAFLGAFWVRIFYMVIR